MTRWDYSECWGMEVYPDGEYVKVADLQTVLSSHKFVEAMREYRRIPPTSLNQDAVVLAFAAVVESILNG